MIDSKQCVADFRELASHDWQRPFLGFLQSAAEPLFRVNSMNHGYRLLLGKMQEEGSFFDHGLSVLGVGYTISEEDLAKIPTEGPILLVANHPYGGVDGLIFGSILDRVRSDGMFLANYLLKRVNNMGGRCFYVDPFGGPSAAKANFKGLKQSLRWLKDGHALATFPSGTVSHLRWGSREVTDPVWAENLAPLVEKSGATVVPVYFKGRNSTLFQAMGLLHPRLRTAMLGREMMRSQNRSFEVRVGKPISAKRLRHFDSNRDVMDFLRLRSYILQNREVASKTTFTSDNRKASFGAPIAPAQGVESLEIELAKLPAEALLVEHPPFEVYAAKAGQIPNVLHELGRLREITFRAVGEGTGESIDLDRFDVDYRHLFIWNREEREIVGAYRLGLTDEILPSKGKKGLYTTTLFRFKNSVLFSMNPAIELGRSFVVEKYQRKPVSLGLLWKGIGQFLVRHPQYYNLFGPVSMSSEYQSLSRNLMVTYLKEHTLDPVLASKVKPRHPSRSRFFGGLDKTSFQRSVRNIDDVSALISEIERGEKGVPVLMRQYLKLNATFISFNLDPDFNNALDGLMLVDLRRTPARMLERYLGEEGARQFAAFHKEEASTVADADPH